MPGLDHNRRGFLTSSGRFALTVPPAMTVLLSTSLSSPAIARSSGGTFSESSSAGSGGGGGVGPSEVPTTKSRRRKTKMRRFKHRKHGN